MNSYDKVFIKNKLWINKKLEQDSLFFKKLNEDQKPEILFIGCSDSRILIGQMMGLEPGEVFVHRNIANLISIDDLNASSVIDYAVRHLKVKHIVVCGHYNCGGVGAAMTDKDFGVMNPWLDQIKKVQHIYQGELDQIKDQNQKYRKLVELNVKEQCQHVFEMPIFIEKKKIGKLPTVHGWVFDFETGKLKDLLFDFE